MFFLPYFLRLPICCLLSTEVLYSIVIFFRNVGLKIVHQFNIRKTDWIPSTGGNSLKKDSFFPMKTSFNMSPDTAALMIWISSKMLSLAWLFFVLIIIIVSWMFLISYPCVWTQHTQRTWKKTTENNYAKINILEETHVTRAA